MSSLPASPYVKLVFGSSTLNAASWPEVAQEKSDSSLHRHKVQFPSADVDRVLILLAISEQPIGTVCPVMGQVVT